MHATNHMNLRFILFINDFPTFLWPLGVFNKKRAFLLTIERAGTGWHGPRETLNLKQKSIYIASL